MREILKRTRLNWDPLGRVEVRLIRHTVGDGVDDDGLMICVYDVATGEQITIGNPHLFKLWPWPLDDCWELGAEEKALAVSEKWRARLWENLQVEDLE